VRRQPKTLPPLQLLVFSPSWVFCVHIKNPMNYNIEVVLLQISYVKNKQVCKIFAVQDPRDYQTQDCTSFILARAFSPTFLLVRLFLMLVQTRRRRKGILLLLRLL
jgi:hypothetical protein